MISTLKFQVTSAIYILLLVIQLYFITYTQLNTGVYLHFKSVLFVRFNSPTAFCSDNPRVGCPSQPYG